MQLESKWNTSLFLYPPPPPPRWERVFGNSWFGPCLYFITGLMPLPRFSGAAAFGFINLPTREVPRGGQTLVVRNLLWLVWKMNKWAHYFLVILQRRTVCLIKCRSRQSQPGLTRTFYLSFCLSEEFKCVMNKAVVIWNIIPLHWWNYKDGESSQIMLIVFYHERCPCWSCGAWRKGRLGMK